ncbi:MAG: ATP phosphoribosyltransferase [Candidatus Neomarinimicrobiota bacterium]|jgi:ATP phosphoribosyltransferase
MLTLAIQKKGRLSSKSIELLEKCGIHLKGSGQDKLKTSSYNFPLDVLFLRDDDIPSCVEDGIADIGIVGDNVVYETDVQLEKVMPLGYGKCRLSIAVPKSSDYTDLSSLENKRIATSFGVILQKYLDEKGVKADIHTISGSVEIAPGIGMADAIFDIVSTGSTLISNGLKEVDTLLYSEASLYCNKNISDEKRALLDKICFRISSVKTAKDYKYILLNVPNDKLDIICEILPGMKSPTIMPLGEKDWSSVHSVIKGNKFWDIIEQLKKAGAESLLVTDIEQMIL